MNENSRGYERERKRRLEDGKEKLEENMAKTIGK